MSFSTTDIRRTLQRALSNRADESSVNRLVRIAFQFAVIRLKQLMRSGKLHLHSFNLPLDGIAFDCIADLFQRDAEGRFIDLEEYFSGDRDLNCLDDAEVEHHFRSLVFTKLQDGIFRLYRDNDPVLARILRNIKAAVPKVSGAVFTFRLGQQVISSIDECNRNDHLPGIDIEWLEHELCVDRIRAANTVQAMADLLAVVNTQQRYRRSIALIDAAVVLKRLMVAPPNGEIEQSSVGQELFAEEVNEHLNLAVGEARTELADRYVATGKLTLAVFGLFMSALEEMMRDIFLRNDGEEKAHHDYLRQSIPDLTYNEYRTVHRTHFEYMVRVMKKIVKERLKELL